MRNKQAEPVISRRRRLALAGLSLLGGLAALAVVVSAGALILGTYFSAALPAILATAIVAAGPVAPFVALGIGLALLIGIGVGLLVNRYRLEKQEQAKAIIDANRDVAHGGPELGGGGSDLLSREALGATVSAGRRSPIPGLGREPSSGNKLVLHYPNDSVRVGVEGGAAPGGHREDDEGDKAYYSEPDAPHISGAHAPRGSSTSVRDARHTAATTAVAGYTSLAAGTGETGEGDTLSGEPAAHGPGSGSDE